jgi:hypothetical protein
VYELVRFKLLFPLDCRLPSAGGSSITAGGFVVPALPVGEALEILIHHSQIELSEEERSDPMFAPNSELCLKEICPRGNNNIVIIIFLVHDNVYTPC